MSFHIPRDMTIEEYHILDLVKQNMLKKLSDVRKVIFLYCIEMGRTHRDAAKILELHESSISNHIKGIRTDLKVYKGVSKNDKVLIQKQVK